MVDKKEITDMEIARANLAQMMMRSPHQEQRTHFAISERMDKFFSELGVSSIGELTGHEARIVVWLVSWDGWTADGLVSLMQRIRRHALDEARCLLANIESGGAKEPE